MPMRKPIFPKAPEETFGQIPEMGGTILKVAPQSWLKILGKAVSILRTPFARVRKFFPAAILNFLFQDSGGGF